MGRIGCLEFIGLTGRMASTSLIRFVQRLLAYRACSRGYRIHRVYRVSRSVFESIEGLEGELQGL